MLDSPEGKLTKLTVRSRPGASPSITNPVRQPSVEERLIGWPAFGEAEVALALQRLERAQQHRFPAARTAHHKEAVERGERRRADPAIGREVGIIAGIAVQRSERALEEGDGDGR